MIYTMVYLLYNMVYVGRKDSSRHSMLPTLASSQNQSDCCRSMWRSTSPELLSWKIWSSKCCITQTLTRRTWIMTCTTVWWGVSKMKTFRSSICGKKVMGIKQYCYTSGMYSRFCGSWSQTSGWRVASTLDSRSIRMLTGNGFWRATQTALSRSSWHRYK